jgi:putative ABC transport system ATP-binding protein
MSLLEVNHLRKIYTTRFGGAKVQALTDVTFTVEEGEFVTIMGESGSGKTTLLNILASLDKPTAGEVTLKGMPMTVIKESKLAAFRREHLGFIFQDFNLLDTFSVQDNIYLPLVLSGRPFTEMSERLAPLAESLSIKDILKKFPYEISGGQKQRVAAARALITHPDIVLADEPTGALDSKAAGALLNLLADINRRGQTIFMVTHSARAASKSGRVLFIRDGEVFHQIYRGDASDEEMHKKISHALTVSAGGNHA